MTLAIGAQLSHIHHRQCVTSCQFTCATSREAGRDLHARPQGCQAQPVHSCLPNDTAAGQFLPRHARLEWRRH